MFRNNARVESLITVFIKSIGMITAKEVMKVTDICISRGTDIALNRLIEKGLIEAVHHV